MFLKDVKYHTKGLIHLTKINSKDFPKVGAVIISDDVTDPLSMDFNKVMCSGDNCTPRSAEDVKNKYVIHAEALAIVKAARNGIRTEGAMMIVVGKCICHECAKLIIEAGIVEVHCPKPDTNSKWVESNQIALALLEENNVKVHHEDMYLGIEEGLTDDSRYR